MARLENVADDPFAPNPNIRPLAGTDNVFRLRVGNHRAVYELEQAEHSMVTVRVFHRQEGY